MNPVTQSSGCGDPYVVALKVDTQDVVMSWCRTDNNLSYIAARIAHGHFRLAVCKGWSIDGPVDAVVIGQSFVRTEPGMIRIDAFHVVRKVRRKPAVFRQKVVPITTVVPAIAKIGRRSEYSVHIADRGHDLMDQSLILEEHDLILSIRIVILVPSFRLLVALEYAAAPYCVVNLGRCRRYSISPYLHHWRVPFVVERPLAGARIALHSDCRS